MSNGMDDFYRDVMARTDEELAGLSGNARTVVLFRVALETGAREAGLLTVVHLMSRLLATTIGIMNSDNEESFEDILNDFEEEGKMPN